MEVRHMRAECRASGTDGRTFDGSAIVYGEETLIGSTRWGFYETMAPGAARDSIANDDIVFLDAHDTAKPLARTSAGTLTLRDTMAAVLVECPTIPSTSYGDDLVENLRNGNVAGMSFGFDVLDDTWGFRTVEGPNGMTFEVETRTVNSIKLYEVSTTAFPAYPTTSAAVRAVLRARGARAGDYPTPVDYAAASKLREAIVAEWREGKTLSADTVEQLQNVLDLIAQADEAVDAAQPALAGLMGVANPDVSTEAPDEGDGDDTDGNVDPNASQEGNRNATAEYDLRLRAMAAYHCLPIPV